MSDPDTPEAPTIAGDLQIEPLGLSEARPPSEGGRVTSRDVARVAGVSQTTVSRVLHDATNVNPRTRERVLQALQSLGYAPNAIARAMVTGKSGAIGIVVENITNPFYPELLEALTHELAEANLRMVLWNAGAAGEPSAIAAIRQRLVDGVIFTTATPESASLREALSHNAPVVLVNRHVEGLQCDTVATDNVGGGRLVASYLSTIGHRRIGLLSGPPSMSTAVEREQGFRESLADHGLSLLPEHYLVGTPSYEFGYQALHRLVALPTPPTALFCINDVTAFGVLAAAQELQLPVPDAIAVVGFDDMAMASWAVFNLTTVRQPIPEMAAATVQLLLKRIEEPERAPEHVRFESKLIARHSTRRPSHPAPAVV